MQKTKSMLLKTRKELNTLLTPCEIKNKTLLLFFGDLSTLTAGIRDPCENQVLQGATAYTCYYVDLTTSGLALFSPKFCEFPLYSYLFNIIILQKYFSCYGQIH